MGGTGSQIVQGAILVLVGVIVIAAIYQLQQPKSGQASVLSSGSSMYGTTLTDLFKSAA
jgi:hypothetical protein